MTQNKSIRTYFGDVKPTGWMYNQINHDLLHGFVGKLDQMVPDLIVEDDIYNKDRLTRLVKSKDVGAVNSEGEWNIQFLWWNSETQSNWWDGYIRHAFLSGDQDSIDKVKKYVDDKLSSQDEDGYIGVYGTDLRYQHTTENGELWAKASLFRGLIAYYEITNDERVLKALLRAMDNTMENYPIGNSTPFKTDKPFAGVGHGLTFTDVCFQLYNITGESKYLDYAVFLFDDYNRHQVEEEDILIKNLMDEEYKFKGHGVHTYEHLRSLVVAYEHTKKSKYKNALEAYLQKLSIAESISGGPIGDEWVFGRHAHSESTGYEYCSIHELLDSFTLLLHYDKDSLWGDKIEWLFFNAAQGARHPEHSSIAYCKSDDSYSMCGEINSETCEETKENRFKYSPVHKDVAVCCVPNAGRIHPYYVQNMWAIEGDEIYINLYGPSIFSTEIEGSEIVFEQVTNYPIEDKIIIKATSNKQVDGQLMLRVPKWAKNFKINGESPKINKKGYAVWKGLIDNELSLTIEMGNQPAAFKHTEGTYFAYGPLLFALPLEGKEEKTKEWGIEGFYDSKYQYTDDSLKEAVWVEGSELKKIDNSGAHYLDQVTIETSLKVDDEIKIKSLVPIGRTVLRKITF
ncbi:glycoside hydrolase family 127 protein [Flammeovirga yaeyamensis]|uniref:Glycoside hydrolase family 127 protein n=1 Tax=Flammeovirga yaeyamensis TaxID=367791 RepID=A0AAX1NAN5_9BACT|nr:beta-L-arabinofuranosidase domain-containing protein [Flammeovirga yaeyamensis]MBB3700000.1 hypothetical protein [Flammeovirga yaeyamensis]NMF37561.1 hypothetical protein [Flammeovirga yaeyamensis]QWG04618.1 glycoside hydrolase family 127 protein [Flammeovirga yaeyamensis]